MKKIRNLLPFTALALTGLALVSMLEKPRAVEAQSKDTNTPSQSIGENSPNYTKSIIGLRIAPVPLNFGDRDPQLVGLGSYYVNLAGGCNDCHTLPSYTPGHNPYLGQPKEINAAGYMAGGHPFPGDNGETVIPPNVTPDASGKPRGLSYQKFDRAFRYGQDPDNPRRILQVMPWPIFQDEFTELDVRAIYAYLSSIPSLPTNPN